MKSFFRALLKLLPHRFRERFEEEVLDTLVAGYRHERSRGRVAGGRFVLLAVVDLVRSGAAERLRALGGPRGPNGEHTSLGGRMGVRRWIEALVSDVRIAIRTLARRPGFTATAVVTLGLGIGAATTMYGVVDGVLLEPLPYPEPQRIVTVSWANAEDPEGGRGGLSALNIRDAAELPAFQSLVGIGNGDGVLTGLGTPRSSKGSV